MSKVPSEVDPSKVFAEAKDYWHLLWLNGASCTGCSISFAQAANPDLVQILTQVTVGASELPIALPDWMHAVHPAAGTAAKEMVESWIEHKPIKTGKVLIIEGAVQAPGYCYTLGMDFRELLEKCAKAADCVIAFGSCSSFGGIPKAKPNVTGAIGVADFLKERRIEKPVINLPRCPGNPDSLTLTLAALMGGIGLKLDKHNRPTIFYGKNMHDELCPYRTLVGKVGRHARENFRTLKELTEKEVKRPPAPEGRARGCTFKIGCKGSMAYTDCMYRKWNANTSECVEAGGPCIACSEPEFPDGRTAPFYKPKLELVGRVEHTLLMVFLIALALSGAAFLLSKRFDFPWLAAIMGGMRGAAILHDYAAVLLVITILWLLVKLIVVPELHPTRDDLRRWSMSVRSVSGFFRSKVVLVIFGIMLIGSGFLLFVPAWRDLALLVHDVGFVLGIIWLIVHICFMKILPTRPLPPYLTVAQTASRVLPAAWVRENLPRFYKTLTEK